MNANFEKALHLSRREFFGRTASGIGIAALASLLQEEAALADVRPSQRPNHPTTHFPPKAKRVIVLWQGGAPSHVDLFDYKPGLVQKNGQEVPESVRSHARLSTMTSGQKAHPVLPAIRPFQQYGKSGIWLSSLLPHTG